MLRIYRRPDGQHSLEECFYLGLERVLMPAELDALRWLIQAPQTTLSDTSSFADAAVVEIGPRLSVETPFSSNAVSICRAMGLPVVRMEMSTRYALCGTDRDAILRQHLDRMTQEAYPVSLTSFGSHVARESVHSIDVLGDGKSALERANRDYGFGMDGRDIDYYVELFHQLGRNPTLVECFQLANANSDHSRHWLFRGEIVIDGIVMPRTLMDIVQAPWKADPGASLVAFHDNAGVSEGEESLVLMPARPGRVSWFDVRTMVMHTASTAETHNHPTLVAPYPGAATGAGGRMRDSEAVRRGASYHAGSVGYGIGALHIPGHPIPGDPASPLTHAYASPLEILIQGSNGACDYGNCIGEPLIGGFVRSFDGRVGAERVAFGKPILYSAGIGFVPETSGEKEQPQTGWLIVAIGGPAYPIGIGGGAASSMGAGTNDVGLDFASVQRGNPEMENRTNRVIRTCVELGAGNPIRSIHDQGAGGPSNVLTELLEPLGGTIDLRRIVCGDKTMTPHEIWVAEAQERYGILVAPEGLATLRAICERESVSLEILGEITGSGRVVVEDSKVGSTLVDLSLEGVLSGLPQKRFEDARIARVFSPLSIPPGLSVRDMLWKILVRPEVGSKGYLVHKGDRSVGGCVAQQQCCGPAQIPVSGVSVLAASMLDHFGVAAAIGEQPIKGLIDAAAGARMSVAEMLTNMASALVTCRDDIRCRANWMWPAKQPGELARLFDAATAISDLMIALGICADGGKDSSSMTLKIDGGTVASPGTLVVHGRAAMRDVREVVTPDFVGGGKIGLIDLGLGKDRLGGSSLAIVLGELGNEPPDIDDVSLLGRAFDAVQQLIAEGLITAYHDKSDGGLLTAIVEMAMAGFCGAHIFLEPSVSLMAPLFNEEAGMVFEYTEEKAVARVLRALRVPWHEIGWTDRARDTVTVAHNGRVVFSETLSAIRMQWEATSSVLDALQANSETAAEERLSHAYARPSAYRLTFEPVAPNLMRNLKCPVAVIRAPGTNGDREMIAACQMAGLNPFDVNMENLQNGDADLADFRMACFAGGFSNGDVLGSAKGWAGMIRYNPGLAEMFERFYCREDTLSFGVCNGFQLMTLLGWLPYRDLLDESQPRLVRNRSRRFESRWVRGLVLPNPAVMLSSMEGSILGVPVAHGEGQLLFPDPSIARDVRDRQLAPLAYVDPDGDPTTAYPHNPNGSPEGWAALCSPDGRHFGMMPHPERAVLMWEWHYVPEHFRHLEASPWLQMFHDAHAWLRVH